MSKEKEKPYDLYVVGYNIIGLNLGGVYKYIGKNEWVKIFTDDDEELLFDYISICKNNEEYCLYYKYTDELDESDSMYYIYSDSPVGEWEMRYNCIAKKLEVFKIKEYTDDEMILVKRGW